ncbi:MAG: DUF167 domain-containing protein [archaeon]
MIIKVKVKPSYSKREIQSFGDGNYLVYLKSSPENNKANIELVNLLSKHFGTPPGRIKIKSGVTSKFKLIEIK